MNARHVVSAALLAISAGSSAPSVFAGGDARSTLASYRLSALDGRQTTLSSYRGEVVVVSFWASWCAHCRRELSVLNGWNEEWAARGGRVVGVSTDRDLRKARRFASDEGLTLTVLHDGPAGLAQALDIPSLPCTLLLDRDGRVVTMVRGSSPQDLEPLYRQAEALLRRPASPGIQSAGMGDSPAANGIDPEQ